LQRSKRDRRARDLKDEGERLDDIRVQLGEEQKREGQLVGEEQAYHRNVARRDALVREISKKNGIKGFDHDSLDKNQWIDFRSRMNELQRRHALAVETTQREGHEKNQEFTLQLQSLHANIATLKAERESLLKQIVRARVLRLAASR
jgi:DNA repair protein RAD50